MFRLSELDKLLLWAFGSHFLGAVGLGCHDVGYIQSRFKQTEFSGKNSTKKKHSRNNSTFHNLVDREGREKIVQISRYFSNWFLAGQFKLDDPALVIDR